MVGMMLKTVLVIAVLISSVIFGPSIFGFKQNETETPDIEDYIDLPGDSGNRKFKIDVNQNITDPNMTAPGSEPRAGEFKIGPFDIDTKEIIGKIIGFFDDIQKALGYWITIRLKRLFPQASPVLGSLVVAVILVAVAWWKSEWVAISIRAILLIVIMILILGIVLAMLGLLP